MEQKQVLGTLPGVGGRNQRRGEVQKERLGVSVGTRGTPPLLGTCSCILCLCQFSGPPDTLRFISSLGFTEPSKAVVHTDVVYHSQSSQVIMGTRRGAEGRVPESARCQLPAGLSQGSHGQCSLLPAHAWPNTQHCQPKARPKPWCPELYGVSHVDTADYPQVRLSYPAPLEGALMLLGP